MLSKSMSGKSLVEILEATKKLPEPTETQAEYESRRLRESLVNFTPRPQEEINAEWAGADLPSDYN